MLTLQSICIDKILQILDNDNFHPKLINQLCKWLPDHLLEPIFYHLVNKQLITDVTLIQFLIPSRIHLHMPRTINVMNSTLKQIGYNCPNMLSLDLSDCCQVSNAVIRGILHGCSNLTQLTLDRCCRISDSIFDSHQSPFSVLYGLYSLESISLQGCPQIRGNLTESLNKNCRKLRNLNLSQCKNLERYRVTNILNHSSLRQLNLSFIENITDESFDIFQLKDISTYKSEETKDTTYIIPTYIHEKELPLQILNISRSNITDIGISYISYMKNITELYLEWCVHITDDAIASLTCGCSLLQVLDFKSCQITDKALSYIAKQCVHLLAIDISWCESVTDNGVLAMCSVASYERERDVNHTEIVGEMARGIERVELRGGGGDGGEWGSGGDTENEYSVCKSLERVSMKWCSKVTETSLTALAEMSSMKQVFISGCSGIDEETVQELRRKHEIMIES